MMISPVTFSDFLFKEARQPGFPLRSTELCVLENLSTVCQGICTTWEEKSLPCKIFYCVRSQRALGRERQGTHLVLVIRVGFPEEEATIAEMGQLGVRQVKKTESEGKRNYQMSKCGWAREGLQGQGGGVAGNEIEQGQRNNPIQDFECQVKRKSTAWRGGVQNYAKLNVHWVFGPLKKQTQELIEIHTVWKRTRGLLLFNLLIRCK